MKKHNLSMLAATAILGMTLVGCSNPVGPGGMPVPPSATSSTRAPVQEGSPTDVPVPETEEMTTGTLTSDGKEVSTATFSITPPAGMTATTRQEDLSTVEYMWEAPQDPEKPTSSLAISVLETDADKTLKEYVEEIKGDDENVKSEDVEIPGADKATKIIIAHTIEMRHEVIVTVKNGRLVGVGAAGTPDAFETYKIDDVLASFKIK